MWHPTSIVIGEGPLICRRAAGRCFSWFFRSSSPIHPAMNVQFRCELHNPPSVNGTIPTFVLLAMPSPPLSPSITNTILFCFGLNSPKIFPYKPLYAINKYPIFVVPVDVSSALPECWHKLTLRQSIWIEHSCSFRSSFSTWKWMGPERPSCALPSAFWFSAVPSS